MKPQKNVESMVGEIKALGEGKVIKSQEARELQNALLRLAETLAFGEPKTKQLPKHHG